LAPWITPRRFFSAAPLAWATPSEISRISARAGGAVPLRLSPSLSRVYTALKTCSLQQQAATMATLNQVIRGCRKPRKRKSKAPAL
ncbi:hypothetical protein EV182_006314, partial [Spiromyces aspiralis]